MAANDSQARPISTTVQLLVEERTPEIFFREMTEQLGMTNIQVRNFGSIKELDAYLASFSRLAMFEERVRVLGIIRDAEDLAADAAFVSVCHSLQKNKFIPPSRMNSVEGADFKTGVFILPDCTGSGMLESLLLQSVADRPEMPCVDALFQCIQDRGATLPPNMTKAKTFAFLATQDLNQPIVGRAAQAKIWPWDNLAFAPLASFLQSLARAQ